MTYGDGTAAVKGLLRDHPGTLWSTTAIADRLQVNRSLVCQVLASECKREGSYYRRQSKGVYYYSTQSDLSPREPVKVQPIRKESPLPVRKSRVSRYIVAIALAKNGGRVAGQFGDATAKLHEISRFPSSPKVLTQLLKQMETDEEVKRLINGKKCYEIMLTDKGYAVNELMHMVGVEPPPPEYPALRTSDGSEEDEAPVETEAVHAVAGSPQIVQVPVELDYDEMVRSVRKLLESEQQHLVDRAEAPQKELDEIKDRLGIALEQAKLWQERAQAQERRANAFEEQLEDAQRRIREMKQKRKETQEDTRHLTEIDEVIKVARATPGWEVTRTGTNHYRFTKDGKFVTTAGSTISDRKGWMPTRTALRQHGLNV